MIVEFENPLWKYGGKASWFFVTIPREDSDDIERFCSDQKRPFGSIAVTVEISSTTWATSIFFDSKTGCYLLPVKSDIRKKIALVEGTSCKVRMHL